MMYCRYCGFQLTDNAHFCTKCGKAVMATVPPPPPGQQTTQTAPPPPPNSAPQNNQPTTPPPTSRPFNPQPTAPTPPPTNLQQTVPPPVNRQTPPQPGPATPPPVNTPPTNGYSPQDIQQGVQRTFNSIRDIIAQLRDNDIKASATSGEIICTSSPAQNAFLRLLRKGNFRL